LSATLYHMLTGQAPIDAPARQAGMKLPSPREVNPSISEAVSRAVMAGLEIDYRKRPRSVDDFLSLLGKGEEKSFRVSPPIEEIPVVREIIGFNFWNSLKGTVSSVKCINFSPDGSSLIVGGSGQSIDIWRLQDCTLLPPLGRYNTPVLDIAFTPTGEILASGIWKQNKVWCVKTDKLLHMFSSASSNVQVLKFSPDGKLLAAGGTRGIAEVWRVADGLLLRTLAGKSNRATAVAFSGDGAFLACGYDDLTINIWSTKDWRLLGTLKGENYARCLSFSPSGGLLAVGEGEKSVKIWDWMKGEVKETLPHNSAITTLAFYPDGNFLASGCESGALQVWKVKDGILLQKLDWHQAPLMSIVFSPDGRFIASGDSYGNINIGKFDEEVCEGIRQGLIALGALAFAYWEKIQPVLDQWNKDVEVAKSTPRTSLRGVIKRLEGDKRAFERVEAPSAFQSIKQGVMGGMQAVIEALSEFAKNMIFPFQCVEDDAVGKVTLAFGELMIALPLASLIKYIEEAVLLSKENDLEVEEEVEDLGLDEYEEEYDEDQGDSLW
ncbi:MAG: hypothetical protein ACPLPS_09325, partial [bacterium]